MNKTKYTNCGGIAPVCPGAVWLNVTRERGDTTAVDPPLFI